MLIHGTVKVKLPEQKIRNIVENDLKFRDKKRNSNTDYIHNIWKTSRWKHATSKNCEVVNFTNCQ